MPADPGPDNPQPVDQPGLTHTLHSTPTPRSFKARGNASRPNNRPPQRQQNESLQDGQQQDGVNDVGGRPPPRERPQEKKKPRPRPPQGSRRDKKVELPSGTQTPPAQDEAGPAPKLHPNSRRRQQFGSKLTTTTEGSAQTTAGPATRLLAPETPVASANREHLDLTHKLIASFARSASNTDDAPDCPICFNSITPGAHIWSCSPTPDDQVHVTSGGVTCWTPFHLKCIKEWASKNVKDTHDAWSARGISRLGEWRCPGCQTRRSFVPKDYLCFCGRQTDPRPGRLATPHSCGEGCSRTRGSCEHPCMMQCHPGPCPPCGMTVTKQCHCGKQTLSLRCSTLKSTTLEAPLSCHQTCDKTLDCGNHSCLRTCHDGPCDDCPVLLSNKCYCGRETRSMRCGEGQSKQCVVDGEGRWEGFWSCETTCDRPFDCGKHKCQKPCHLPSPTPAHCPRSPDVIITCPCSRSIPLSSLPAPPRERCTDPIPSCSNTCSKPLPNCSHLCEQQCHEGACWPCEIQVDERCRCGRIGRRRMCHEVTASLAEGDVFLCERKCPAFRHCGRHTCHRLCCPLGVLSGLDAKGKGKKREVPSEVELQELDPEGWHTCDLVCNKLLSCGNHTCTERDHRGPCPRCLQSSFSELICNCGQTILEPPIPCGTIIHCSYPCRRPPPPCGHPRAPHTCHDDTETCPPCPHLADKPCACGKTVVKNVRCSTSSDKVGCGTKCGKPVDCGWHSCDRMCHPGACGTCNQTCAKPRRSCGHPCPLPCHAPSTCNESTPCPAPITLSCACGRLSKPSTCSASSSGSKKTSTLPCVQECAIAKRNEKLAAALGIDPARQPLVPQVKYSEALQTFARINGAFLATAEKALHEFVNSDKGLLLLPPMPLPKRQFIRGLAEQYRLDGEDVDQEPKRSVQLRRRIDSRIPNPLLSSVIAPAPAKSTGTLSSLAPVRSAWGLKLAAPTTAAAAIGSKSATPISSAWTAMPATRSPALSAVAVAATPPSRPLTPKISLKVASPPRKVSAIASESTPAVQNASEDVPDSWDELSDP